MSTSPENKPSFSFSNLFKNLLYIFIIIQFIPMIFSTLKQYGQDIISSKTKVGLIRLSGVLSDSTFYVQQLHKFAKDKSIKALLLKIESPGGNAGTGQALFMELKKFREKKPVVVLVENVCASTAYYAASAANQIIAAPSAAIGSIGAVMEIPKVKDFLTDWKVRVNYVQAGDYKTVGSPYKDDSADDMAYLQENANVAYQQFIKDIASSRNLKFNEEKIWANGKIFMGSSALRLGLIDQLGSLQTAIDELKKQVDSKEDIKFEIAQAPTNFIQNLMGKEKTDDSLETEECGFVNSCSRILGNAFVYAVRTLQGPKVI